MATPEQVKEIEDAIREARSTDAEAAKELDSAKRKAKEKKAAEKYQTAIRLADEYYAIPLPTEALGEPIYDPELDADGRALWGQDPKKKGRGKARVLIGPSGFLFFDKLSAAWLAAVKVHELLGHCRNGCRIEWLDPKKEEYVAFPKLPLAEDEFLAYLRTLEWADRLGLTKPMIDWIKRQMKNWLPGLPKTEQEKWKKKFKFLALLPPRTLGEAFGGLLVPPGHAVLARDCRWVSFERYHMVDEIAQYLWGGNVAALLDANPQMLVTVGLARSAFAEIEGREAEASDQPDLPGQQLQLADPAAVFQPTILRQAEILEAMKARDEQKSEETTATNKAKKYPELAEKWTSAAEAAERAAMKHKDDADPKRRDNRHGEAGDAEDASADEENKASDSHSRAARNWDKVAEHSENEAVKLEARQEAKKARQAARKAKQRAAEAHERAADDHQNNSDPEKEARAREKHAAESEEVVEDDF